MQAQLEMKLHQANQYLQSGQMDQAETLIRQILAVDPDNASAGSALAALYTRQQKYELAIEILDQTCKKNPDHSGALVQSATIYKNWGKFDEAKACYRRAIELDTAAAPQNLLALATTCKFSEYDDDVRLIEEAHGNAEENSIARRFLAFALGKGFDDLRIYEKAFGYFQEGNQIVATASDFSIAVVERGFQSIKRAMGPEFFAHHEGTGIADNTPIFVTGLPRSGTTLVEQILASHPKVHGAGELDILSRMVAGICIESKRPFPFVIDTLDPEVLRGKASRYVDELSALAGDKTYVTDKSVSSFAYIGLIKIMMPNAKIIHCGRDCRDVGLSIYQLDLGHTFPWAYKQEWIGKYQSLFNDLADHWNQCMPGEIYSIQYEELITDPEHHIRALLEYCNLEFDPACLAFHLTDRVVMTSSRSQVRQPIYKGSAGRWKNYAEYLGPLISALGMDPV